MDWQGLITTVVTSTTVIAAVAWLARALISQRLTRDIERFKAALVTANYHSIALKDREGKPYVNPKAKQVWDAAVGTIPPLKVLLENEFRSLLGVTPVTKKPE